MGVIKVPTAESRMGPGELPNFRAHSNASPEAFGSGVAKATQNLGAVVGEMAGLAEKYDDMVQEDKYNKLEKDAIDDMEKVKTGGILSTGEKVEGWMNGNYDPDKTMGQYKGIRERFENHPFSRRVRYKKGNQYLKMVHGEASQFVTYDIQETKKKAIEQADNNLKKSEEACFEIAKIKQPPDVSQNQLWEFATRNAEEQQRANGWSDETRKTKEKEYFGKNFRNWYTGLPEGNKDAVLADMKENPQKYEKLLPASKIYEFNKEREAREDRTFVKSYERLESYYLAKADGDFEKAIDLLEEEQKISQKEGIKISDLKAKEDNFYSWRAKKEKDKTPTWEVRNGVTNTTNQMGKRN